MPDYGEILAFLANNPPQLRVERELHASLLELLASCLREDARPPEGSTARLTERIIQYHRRRARFN